MQKLHFTLAMSRVASWLVRVMSGSLLMVALTRASGSWRVEEEEEEEGGKGRGPLRCRADEDSGRMACGDKDACRRG